MVWKNVFDNRFHQQLNKMSDLGGVHPECLKAISVICQNWMSIVKHSKTAFFPWYKSSSDSMQLEHGGSIIRKIDLEKDLN